MSVPEKSGRRRQTGWYRGLRPVPGGTGLLFPGKRRPKQGGTAGMPRPWVDGAAFLQYRVENSVRRRWIMESEISDNADAENIL